MRGAAFSRASTEALRRQAVASLKTWATRACPVRERVDFMNIQLSM
jgi:hypothetical protein